MLGPAREGEAFWCVVVCGSMRVVGVVGEGFEEGRLVRRKLW